MAKDNVSYMMWVKGEDQKLPSDVKMKVEFANQPEGLLGMYAQVSMNDVQGKAINAIFETGIQTARQIINAEAN